MTTKDKTQLLEFIKLYDNQELDCNGNCDKCYYCVHSSHIGINNCPLLITYDMIYKKIYETAEWDERKG